MLCFDFDLIRLYLFQIMLTVFVTVPNLVKNKEGAMSAEFE